MNRIEFPLLVKTQSCKIPSTWFNKVFNQRIHVCGDSPRWQVLPNQSLCSVPVKTGSVMADTRQMDASFNVNCFIHSNQRNTSWQFLNKVKCVGSLAGTFPSLCQFVHHLQPFIQSWQFDSRQGVVPLVPVLGYKKTDLGKEKYSFFIKTCIWALTFEIS